MQRIDIKEVLERVRTGNYSSEDEAVAKYWIHQSHQNDEVLLSKEEWLEVKHKIWADLETIQTIKQPVVKRLWPRIVAAAAVALVVFGAGLFYFGGGNRLNPDKIAYKNDVAPGKQGATLTLASGKKIRLSDASNGELANEAGISINKTVDGQLVYEIKGSEADPNKINTLSTANGETYKVRLPDGSMVYLNAASSLTYPASLNERGLRRVRLDGEAFFQVAKDKAHPFIVQTKNQEIKVLGTEFNVNSYKDEAVVATTLIEGSVQVVSGKHQQVIKPGEQLVNNGTDLNVAKANMENITDWKDGDFYFERVDFRLAMRKIARWYDVEVIYDESVPDDIRSGGWISRNNKLSAVLKSIEKSGQVQFKIEGKKIYVTK
ncbi:transmembrane sensor [Pedobacter africanus]|uniref:FecR family protein n=1 Tax=Pedobacter africanus TaxID=151894 RepID=UPI003395367F